MEQRGLRRPPPPPFHAVSSRANCEPLYRSARLCAHGGADEPGVAASPRLRTVPEVSRGSGGGALRRPDAGRRDLYSAALVAPRRVARVLQCARELLVA